MYYRFEKKVTNSVVQAFDHALTATCFQAGAGKGSMTWIVRNQWQPFRTSFTWSLSVHYEKIEQSYRCHPELQAYSLQDGTRQVVLKQPPRPVCTVFPDSSSFCPDITERSRRAGRFVSFRLSPGTRFGRSCSSSHRSSSLPTDADRSGNPGGRADHGCGSAATPFPLMG